MNQVAKVLEFNERFGKHYQAGVLNLARKVVQHTAGRLYPRHQLPPGMADQIYRSRHGILPMPKDRIHYKDSVTNSVSNASGDIRLRKKRRKKISKLDAKIARVVSKKTRGAHVVRGLAVRRIARTFWVLPTYKRSSIMQFTIGLTCFSGKNQSLPSSGPLPTVGLGNTEDRYDQMSYIYGDVKSPFNANGFLVPATTTSNAAPRLRPKLKIDNIQLELTLSNPTTNLGTQLSGYTVAQPVYVTFYLLECIKDLPEVYSLFAGSAGAAFDLITVLNRMEDTVNTLSIPPDGPNDMDGARLWDHPRFKYFFQKKEIYSALIPAGGSNNFSLNIDGAWSSYSTVEALNTVPPPSDFTYAFKKGSKVLLGVVEPTPGPGTVTASNLAATTPATTNSAILNPSCNLTFSALMKYHMHYKNMMNYSPRVASVWDITNTGGDIL